MRRKQQTVAQKWITERLGGSCNELPFNETLLLEKDMERIIREVRIDRKDDPAIVAEQFSKILNDFGIKCVNTTPNSEDVHYYRIEVEVEVLEFDPEDHHDDHHDDH